MGLGAGDLDVGRGGGGGGGALPTTVLLALSTVTAGFRVSDGDRLTGRAGIAGGFPFPEVTPGGDEGTEDET